MSALPKAKKMRQRRNRTSTAATLSTSAPLLVSAPTLPDRGVPWHPLTLAWWSDSITGVWASPMAKEYDNSDVHGLVVLAGLMDDFWNAVSSSDRKQLASEIRLQRQSYGLSPIDRRRLQWEIVRADLHRLIKQRPAVTSSKTHDSREILRMVK